MVGAIVVLVTALFGLMWHVMLGGTLPFMLGWRMSSGRRLTMVTVIGCAHAIFSIVQPDLTLPAWSNLGYIVKES
jgi:hypothetical protein